LRLFHATILASAHSSGDWCLPPEFAFAPISSAIVAVIKQTGVTEADLLLHQEAIDHSLLQRA
jgi:hypothetical protein